jgi:hypothetical protein
MKRRPSGTFKRRSWTDVVLLVGAVGVVAMTVLTALHQEPGSFAAPKAASSFDPPTPPSRELAAARRELRARGHDCPWAVSLDRATRTVACTNGKSFRLE